MRLGEARLYPYRLGVVGLRPRLLMIAYKQPGALMEPEMQSAIINVIGGLL